METIILDCRDYSRAYSRMVMKFAHEKKLVDCCYLYDNGHTEGEIPLMIYSFNDLAYVLGYLYKISDRSMEKCIESELIL